MCNSDLIVSTSGFGSDNPEREEKRSGSQVEFQNEFSQLQKTITKLRHRYFP